MTVVQTGLEKLIDSPPDAMVGKRLGLLCNPASVDRNFRHARELVFRRFPGRLKALYSPQHGFFAEKQDNMIESGHLTDPLLNLPVFSLYGETRIPTEDMFAPIDTLVVDLQDVGTRVYTFVYTLSHCMEAARQNGVSVVVLDRPNPVGGVQVEGNCLLPEYASFVGRYPVPMRHGLTIGEMARLFNEYFGIGCELTIIPMNGWRREMYFEETGLPWIPPSPNLPTPVSAVVYPGQVIWEGTNVSEGRGTTQPFEVFGAPFLDPYRILDSLDGPVPGVVLRPLVFEPTSGKWAGTPCRGFQLHVTDRHLYAPYRTSLMLLQSVLLHHRDAFEWKQPPYEYEFDRLPVDLILGDPTVRRRLEQGEPVQQMEQDWGEALENFISIRQRFCLYGTEK